MIKMNQRMMEMHKSEEKDCDDCCGVLTDYGTESGNTQFPVFQRYGRQ